MFSPRNNGPFGGSNTFGSRYQYQTLPRGYEGVQSSALISKVMGLLAFSFIFASIGSIAGFAIIHTMTSFWIVAIAGFVVLIALNMLIQRPGINLFLLYLFTFLEGMSLSPLLSAYISAGTTYTNILGEAFLITAVTSLALSVYSWTTKRDFSRLADYLFFGVILLLIVSVMGIFFSSFFNTSLVSLIISGFGVAIFSGYVLYYVQRAHYMADTMPNAIGLTVSLFITVLNLFLYILRILTILQGGDRRR
jgi:FtsH-binding integral membrane protein